MSKKPYFTTLHYFVRCLVVPKAGLEPARPLKRGILNPLRLPFRHLGPLLSMYFLVLIFKSTYVNLISVPTKRLPATTADPKF